MKEWIVLWFIVCALIILVLRNYFVLPKDQSRHSEYVKNIGNKEPLDYRVMWSRETAVPSFYVMPFSLFFFFHFFRYIWTCKMRSGRKDRDVGRFASFPFFLSFISLLLRRASVSLFDDEWRLTVSLTIPQFCWKKTHEKYEVLKKCHIKKNFRRCEEYFKYNNQCKFEKKFEKNWRVAMHQVSFAKVPRGGRRQIICTRLHALKCRLYSLALID